MEYLYITFAIQAMLLGAIFGRVDGGGVFVWNEWVERMAIMSYFVLACIPSAGIFAPLAILGMFGIATGHGQYFPTLVIQKNKPEFFDFIVTAVFGKDPRTLDTFNAGTTLINLTDLYKRCAFGMCVTGSIVGIPAALLCLATGNAYGLALLLTGPVKGFSYVVCDKLKLGTEGAEYLNGALRTLLACIALFGGLHNATR